MTKYEELPPNTALTEIANGDRLTLTQPREGESASSIAESLGVSANTISSAATFRTWRHVGGPLRAGTRKYQQSKQQEVMKEGEFDL